MKNCLILGSGRSGTSMVAGVLAKAGYFMGENLIPAREANPKGFFEDVEVNMINEDLLAQVVAKRVVVMGREFFRARPLEGQRWLAAVALGTRIPCPDKIADRIRAVTQHNFYCFKDPRFCYTLPIWRPFLKNAVFICVFRDPASTAISIVQECKEAAYLHTLAMTFARALNVWRLMYCHVLRIHRQKGNWLFLHYDQLFGAEGLNRLGAFLDVQADATFPEASLRRSFPTDHPRISQRTWRIYEELCGLAGYR
jgi:hypothetical protein